MFHIYFAMIVISALAGLAVYFQKETALYLRLFPIFLLLTILVELAVSYLKVHGKSVQTIYSFFGAFEFLFYMFVLKEIIQKKRQRY